MSLARKVKHYYRSAYASGYYPGITRLLFTPHKVLAYIGHLGDGNFGDELVYEATKTLASPHILLPVTGRMPVLHILCRKILKAKISGVIIGGGTMIGSRFPAKEIFDELAARQKPVYLHGTGVHKVAYDEGWKRNLGPGRVHFGGVRGPMSRQNLSEIGVDVEVAGDAAFALFEPIPEGKTALSRKVIVNLGTHVGYSNEENARKEVRKFISYLLEEGYSVYFLPLWGGDITIAHELRRTFPGITLLEIPRTHEEGIAHFRDACFAIGERLHFNITAFIAGCAFLSINYDKKHEDFLASVGHPDSGIKPEAVTLEAIRGKFDRRSGFDIPAVNRVLRQFKEKQFKAFRDYINATK